LIASLEPKPGRNFDDSEICYIVPDVYVYKIEDEYVVVLNEEGVPRLTISPFYKRFLLDNGDPGRKTKEYVQEKLRSAAWLIKSIHQRQRTLYRVTKSIFTFQQEFLETGVRGLKPLILRDVAGDLGMHESTISRATTNKYVHTPLGLFPLKYFFHNGFVLAGGETMSCETVKDRIRDIIASEDAHQPLSDQAIVEMLFRENIRIARRTVAKYREELRLFPSSRRKVVSR
jgi:RNA polymerase sigma-54 factor